MAFFIWPLICVSLTNIALDFIISFIFKIMHLQVVLYTFLLRLQMETNFGQGLGDPFNYLKKVRLRLYTRDRVLQHFNNV